MATTTRDASLEFGCDTKVYKLLTTVLRTPKEMLRGGTILKIQVVPRDAWARSRQPGARKTSPRATTARSRAK